MITVHQLNGSRAQRILWLLEELGQPYDVVRYEPASPSAPPPLHEVHPLGKSPVLEDDGRVIAESGAIVAYLCHLYGTGGFVVDPKSSSWAHYLDCLHGAECSAVVPFVLSRALTGLAVTPPLQARLDAEIERQLDHLSALLGDKAWFAGPELTGADVMMFVAVEAAERSGRLRDRPNLAAFLERVMSRTAWQAAASRGEP